MTWGKHRQNNYDQHIRYNHKKPTWQSHDREQCYCIESNMVFGIHRHKCGVWRSPITQSLTGATNSGLPQKRQSPCPWPRKSPLESIAAPKLWGERKKERERYLKPTDLWSLSTCCRLSDSQASLAQNCFTTRKTLTLFFLPSLSYSL